MTDFFLSFFSISFFLSWFCALAVTKKKWIDKLKPKGRKITLHSPPSVLRQCTSVCITLSCLYIYNYSLPYSLTIYIPAGQLFTIEWSGLLIGCTKLRINRRREEKGCHGNGNSPFNQRVDVLTRGTPGRKTVGPGRGERGVPDRRQRLHYLPNQYWK